MFLWRKKRILMEVLNLEYNLTEEEEEQVFSEVQDNRTGHETES